MQIYIILLVMIIIGFVIVKRIAGCLLKTLVTLVLLAILACLYFFCFKEGAIPPTP